MYASSQHRWASTRQNHSSRHCPDSLRSRTRWCSWKRAVPTNSPGGMLVQCRRWDQPERCRPRGGELTCRVGPGAASVIHRIGAVASGQPGRWPCRPWAVRGSRAPVAGSRAPSAERRAPSAAGPCRRAAACTRLCLGPIGTCAFRRLWKFPRSSSWSRSSPPAAAPAVAVLPRAAGLDEHDCEAWRSRWRGHRIRTPSMRVACRSRSAVLNAITYI
jgi:hypothetical protein